MIVNISVPPSTIDVFEITNVGVGVTSFIVPVPVAEVFKVLLDVTIPVTVKVSVPSEILSLNVKIGTFTLVLPAGIVTVVVVTV